MATLTSKQLKDSYQGLLTIKTADDANPLSGRLENGLGNAITALGIGTDSPAYKLQINGSGTVARFTDGTSHMDFYSGSGLNEIATASPLLLSVGGTERMRIDSSGKVIITPNNDGDDTLRIYRGSSGGFENTSTVIDTKGGNANIRSISNDAVRAITFSLSSDSGATYAERMRIASSGDISFRDGSASEAFYWDASAGSLGIGTTSPSGKLTVNGASTPSSTPSGTFQITNLGGGTPTQINMGVQDSSPFYGWIQTQHQTLSGFYYNLLLNPQGGNVGIGTSSPQSKLDVITSPYSFAATSLKGTGMNLVGAAGTGVGGGAGAASGVLNIIDNAAMGINNGGTITLGGNYISSGVGLDLTYAGIKGGKENGDNYDSAGYLALYTTPAGASPTERMRIDSSGNVGIGVSPSTKLDVVGTYRMQFRTDDAIPELRAITADGVSFKELGLNGSQLVFNTSSTERMRIDSSGNVSITTGNLILDSGAGIDFSDTPNSSGTMTSELLDDYEEGTWSPEYTSSVGAFATMTMDVLSATYTKIGRQVTVRAYFRTDDVDTAGSPTPASGVLRVSGLPFTASGDSAISVGYVFDWGTAPDSGYVVNGQSYIFLQKTNATADSNVSDLTTGATADQNRIILTATYFV